MVHIPEDWCNRHMQETRCEIPFRQPMLVPFSNWRLLNRFVAMSPTFAFYLELFSRRYYVYFFSFLELIQNRIVVNRLLSKIEWAGRSRFQFLTESLKTDAFRNGAVVWWHWKIINVCASIVHVNEIEARGGITWSGYRHKYKTHHCNQTGPGRSDPHTALSADRCSN